MHHLHYFQSSFSSWKIAALLSVIVLIIALLITIIRRYDMRANGLTGTERKSLPREEREILAMVRQHGSSMSQTEIAENTAGDFSYVVDVLMELEKKAKIRRRWDADRGTYLVSALS